MFGLLLRRACADYKRQETFIRQSNLNLTNVRPGSLADGNRTGAYRHGFSPTDRDIAMKISAADVAEFMLKQLTDDTYLQLAPGLSY